jgi:uncharacterized protein (TIGR00369 family)
MVIGVDVMTVLEEDPVSGFVYRGGLPEVLFRVGETTGDRQTSTGSMALGPWLAEPDGLRAAGSVGVLVDDVFGGVLLTNRPPGHWASSTELSVDFVSPMPSDDRPITAVAGSVRLDRAGGLALGRVTGADGRVIAIGSTRVRFLPAAGRFDPLVPADSLALSDVPIHDVLQVVAVTTDAGPCLALTGDARVSNPAGTVHGGVLLWLAELAGLRAVQSEAHPLHTTSIHLVFLRPAPLRQELRFTTEILHRGRTLAVVQVAGRRADGKVCALATVTCQRP